MQLHDCPLTRGERFEKIAGSPGRVATLDEIEWRTRKLLHAVPITRISEISRLAPSALPVFSATTPLARDLTTHMGKGPDRRAARMSAVMEAIERVSAEDYRGAIVSGSHAGLLARGHFCADPRAFDLPPSTSYRPDRNFDWVEGWDLLAGRPLLVPVDLCVSPPKQGLLDQVDTNGLASGATYGEAIRHALLELIERDATGQHLFASLFAEDPSRGPSAMPIGPDMLDESSRELLARFTDQRWSVSLLAIASEFSVPVVQCLLHDPAYPAASGPVGMSFGGWGCELRLEHAVNRAVTEACQSWVGTIHGTRDSFNLVENASTPLPEGQAGSPHDWSGFPETGDLAQDVGIILDRLSAAGIGQVVVVDMSDARFDIPVVRVRVPGLSAFMADRQRVGWRCMRHLL